MIISKKRFQEEIEKAIQLRDEQLNDEIYLLKEKILDMERKTKLRLDIIEKRMSGLKNFVEKGCKR